MDIYLDANTIINCMLLGCWGAVLATPSYCLHVTENVMAEIRCPGQARLLALAVRTGRLRRVALTEIGEIATYANLKVRLGDGEAATLAAAAGRGGLVGSDEKRRFLREAERLLGSGRVLRTANLAVVAVSAGTTSLDRLRSKVASRVKLAGNRGDATQGDHLNQLLGEVEASLGGQSGVGRVQ